MEASQNGSSECGRIAPMWSSNGDMQRGSSRSPPDLQKMKPCHSAQCGVYDGMSVPVVNGHCQQSPHGRLYPAAYLQQQQQPHPMAVRAVPQQHHHQYHHPGSIQTCHPHLAQSYASTAASGPVPPAHMDRMMQGQTSVASSQQMRSIVMNHYPTTASYPYPHNSSASSSGYYAQAVANTSLSGNGPCMDYSNPGHGPVNGAAQYAQHQRAINVNNTVPTSSANSYRAVQSMGTHSHSKVMNPSQAALYQNAYHQYTQYIQQQQGMMHPQHQQNGPTSGVINMATHHHQQQQQQQAHQQAQQTRLIQYMSRVGQPVPQHHHQNHVYSASCQSHMMSNCGTQPQPLPQPQPQIDETVSDQSMNSEAGTSSSKGVPTSDENCKSSPASTNGTVKENQPSTEADTSKESNRPRTPLVKISSVKLKCRSPGEAIKIKATKSATKIRDRQPKLVIGRKKKSGGTGSISGVSSGKKLKSYLKTSNSCTEAGNKYPPLERKLGSHKNLDIECVHAELLRITKPPPGFECVARPAFPIEMCDPTLLGTLMGCQLSREGLLSGSVQACCGEGLEELLSILPCCDKGVVDVEKLWKSEKRFRMDHDDLTGDDWEILNRAIGMAVDDWNEELNLMDKVQDILHDDLDLKSIDLFKNF